MVKMDDDRAIELVKYGQGAIPKPKTDAEYREAVKYIMERPDLWDRLKWLS